MDVPGQGFPPTSERGDGAESLQAGLPRSGPAADHSPHSSPLQCHASPGSGSRHPNDPSLAGPSSHRGQVRSGQGNALSGSTVDASRACRGTSAKRKRRSWGRPASLKGMTLHRSTEHCIPAAEFNHREREEPAPPEERWSASCYALNKRDGRLFTPHVSEIGAGE